MLLYSCPTCRQALQIPEEYAGTTGRCNYCGGVILVPATTTEDDCPEVLPDLYATPRRVARPGAGMIANEEDYVRARHFSVWRAGLLAVVMLGILACLLPALVIGISAEPEAPENPRRRSVPVVRGAAPAGTPGALATQGPADPVYITQAGAAYHRPDCTEIGGSGVEISVAEARARGLEPCAHCRP